MNRKHKDAIRAGIKKYWSDKKSKSMPEKPNNLFTTDEVLAILRFTVKLAETSQGGKNGK